MGKVGMAALALCLVACAHHEKTQPSTAENVQVTGQIKQVDQQSLLVADSKHPDQPPVLLARQQSSTVMKDGAKIAWSELKAGDSVRVDYTQNLSSPSVANTVVIVGSGSPSQAPPVTEPPPSDSPMEGGPSSP